MVPGQLEPVLWNPGGFFHEDGCNPSQLLDYHTGTVYPQDAASQLPVALLDPRPGEVIFDACAAPGSKTTQIGLKLADTGLLLAADSSAGRRRVLAENLARQGIACAIVLPQGLEQLAGALRAVADGVLLDAPCSGSEGRSRRRVADLAALQLDLLLRASGTVRPGGRLVYSTCSPTEEENEAVVRRFLEERRDWEVVKPEVAGPDSDRAGLGALRLHPEAFGCEPFFACVLRAPGQGERRELPSRILKPENAPLNEIAIPAGLLAWRAGHSLLLATPAAARTDLHCEGRGLQLATEGPAGWRLTPWGAQALIERGAAGPALTRADARRLWAGETLELGLPAGTLVRTEAGAPLGVLQVKGSRNRLDLPSRLCRSGLF